MLNGCRTVRGTGAAIIVFFLAGCGKSVDIREEVRPVRAIRVAATPIDGGTTFSGEVRPRVESRLGFRVAGKINRRNVDVGASVKVGQALAALDPVDLQLQGANAKAQLAAAEIDRTVADADLKRFAEMQRQGFISGAQLEQKQNAAAAARARYDQASANRRLTGNQTAYATLASDMDGVVTAIDAEVGQVVAVGQSVIRVAGTREKEVVVAIPEQAAGAVRVGAVASVAVWAHPETAFVGRVREISPAADPATRTYQVRLALPDPPPRVLLGMTATVRFPAAHDEATLRIPLSALVRDGSAGSGAAMLWVIDPSTMQVHLTPVRLGAANGNELQVASGLAVGQMVVTAGANLLKPNQRVTILADSVSGNPGEPVSARAASGTSGAPAASAPR